MPLTFPSSPINGAVAGEYTYDATKGAWRKNAAYPVSVTHSDVAPSNPRVGDQWWKSNEGTLFTYYNDGSSSQWVESTNVVANVEPNPIPAGAMMAWASNVIPANWLLCDGTAVSRSTYASLFAAIGTQYGSGDGTTTFNLPNLKGRTIVGKDSTQTEFDILGETGGAKTHTLTTAEMPSHTHIQDAHSHTFSGTTSTNGNHNHISNWASITGYNYVGSGGNSNWPFGGGSNAQQRDLQAAGDHNHTFSGTTSSVAATNQSTGGGGAHNNLQPYIVLNYIIKFSAGETPGDSQLAVRVGAVEAANNTKPISQNYVINGAMDIWQRATSGTQSAGGGANCVSVDRWKAASYGAAPAITIARSTDIPSGIGATYSAALSWASSTSTGDVFSSYFIEDGKYIFAGKTVTVSFYAKATTAVSVGASFDQDYAGTNFSLTTSWARYSFTVTLPSTYQTSYPSYTSAGNHTELRLFRMANVSAAANTIYFTGVQVEEGSVATPFRRQSVNFDGELRACKRYYQKSFLYGTVPADNVTSNTITPGTWAYTAGYASTSYMPALAYLEVEMRAAPSIVNIYQPNGTAGAAGATGKFGDIYNRAVSTSYTAALGVDANSGPPNAKVISFVPNGGSGISNVSNPYGVHWTASAEL